ncbi:MAG: ATP-binding protein [Nitrososphaerota archaeon]|nr:ATP-binding protein [Nitrososphaerota archaeon]
MATDVGKEKVANGPEDVPSMWPGIGTIVGDASTGEFTFILKSFKSRVGDIVAVPMDVPNNDYSSNQSIIAWGRILSIYRYNPFFPYESAQELSQGEISLQDTVLSESRDQLEAKVLVLGFTSADVSRDLNLYPLTYPIPPAASVRYPPASAIKMLLIGGLGNMTRLPIGTLIARSDVPVEIAAQRIASRHLAILAMTGGGKTVAARRVIRGFIELGYPLLILDPHGDYLGLWERREKLFPNTKVRLYYPHIVMTKGNKDIVKVLISKMTKGLSEAQQDFLNWVLAQVEASVGEPVVNYINTLILVSTRLADKNKEVTGEDKGKKFTGPTARAVRRSLEIVRDSLIKMEVSNKRLREILNDLTFEELPDPEAQPESVVKPWQVSILYLGGYDHLTQSTIVSILMETLFSHRAELSNRIPPFLTVVEEAHNFVPSSKEGTADTPSLDTLQKVITEGRKFGVGLVLITQRPSRVDETVLSQCNTFLVLRLVNPKDQSYVRSVMENLPESDAARLPGFGPGQGIISGQAVRFPLQVSIKFDEDMVGTRTGDEDFIKQAKDWEPDKHAETRAKASDLGDKLERLNRRGRKRS